VPTNTPRPRTQTDRRVTARLHMATELDKLPPDEREIVERFISHKNMARNVMREFDEHRNFGDRLADNVAAVGGSWSFIIIFLLAMALWMGINSFILRREAFDPYPYILLNLALSCLAALQAPVIMMSQNRQSDSDRAQAKHDYEVNVRAELEILQVHEKINAMRGTDLMELSELIRQQGNAILQINQRLDGGPNDMAAR
jgi:uncharacterized membrane protein